MVLALEQEGETRRQVRRQALQHRGQGGPAVAGALAVVQCQEGRDRPARAAHPKGLASHAEADALWPSRCPFGCSPPLRRSPGDGKTADKAGMTSASSFFRRPPTARPCREAT